MNYQRAFHSIDMDPLTYAKRFALPIVVFGFVFSFLLYVLFPALFVGPTKYIPAMLPVICIIFAAYYPISIAEGKAARIDNNMHYYITQMGSIATAETPRIDIIRIVSENKNYGELADETKKIYDLVTVWNLSLADACKFISKRTPSTLFEDFLDRFAQALQSGEDIKDFLLAEQNVVMSEYESMYDGALYSIEIIKELFISMVMALIFLASFAVIMPIITGMDALLLMTIVAVIFIATDLIMVVFAKSKVPKDPTWQQTQVLTRSKAKLYRSIPFSLAGCLIVAIILILYGKITLPIAIAMISTPLLYTGFIARSIEKGIRRRDRNYSAFIRSLGSSASARGGVINDALKGLLAHDFGPLTKDVTELFRRLTTRIDEIKAWNHFSINTGSNLIHRFSVMFVEAVHLGGKPDTIGNMIAANFHRIVTLRKKRYQSASSLVGVLYGLTGGIGFTMYISLGVVDLMQSMFSSVDMPPGMSMGMILYTDVGSIETLSLIVLFIMISHSFLSAVLIRVVDGGHMLSATIDFVIMVWISGISAVVTTTGVASLLGIT